MILFFKIFSVIQNYFTQIWNVGLLMIRFKAIGDESILLLNLGCINQINSTEIDVNWVKFEFRQIKPFEVN